MKIISRMELKEGMELAEAVEAGGNVLFAAGTKVTAQVIGKLEHYDIIAVSVKEDVDFAKSHNERIQFDQDFKDFQNLHRLVSFFLPLLAQIRLQRFNEPVSAGILTAVHSGHNA